MQPIVTIIIPFLNREGFLTATLNSILKQTFHQWECILIDDGSTDNSKYICDKFILSDGRFQYYKRTDNYKKGGNGARNMGAGKANSNWLIFLDSDDLLAHDCLEQRIKTINNSSKDIDFTVNVTGTFNKEINDNDIVWNSYNPDESKDKLIKRFITLDSPWSTESLTWNKSFFCSIKGWDESLPCWQDWNIHLRALKATTNFLLTKKVDHYYRRDVPNSIAATPSREKYDFGMVKAIHETLHYGGWSRKEKLLLTRLLLIKMIRLNSSCEHFSKFEEGPLALKLKNYIENPKLSIRGIVGRLVFHIINFNKGNKCELPLQ
jgi:glycosyltransferase involved in cell wall biosynthesis